MTDLEVQILQALTEWSNLTAENLARLTQSKLNTVQVALKKLALKKLVLRKPVLNRIQRGIVLTYRLKGQRELTGNIHHELCRNALYVEMRLLGAKILPKSEQRKDFKEDLAFEFEDKLFYMEVETGSHEAKDLKEKVEAYLKLKGHFYVIFTIQDYRPDPLLPIKKTWKQFGTDILAMLELYGRGAQFLVSPHHLFIENPLGLHLVNHQNKQFSLQSLLTAQEFKKERG